MSILTHIDNLRKDLEDTQLIVVTKTRSKKDIMEVIEAGVTMIGENRLQEIEKKYDNQLFTLMKNHQVQLHYIGQFQSNKIPKLVKYCQVVQSVTSLRYAKKISEEAIKRDKHISIFLQLNLTGEEQKAGVTMDQREGEVGVPHRTMHSIAEGEDAHPHLQDLIADIQLLPNLTLLGLMCMGKMDDLEATRSAFRTCRQLANQFGLPEVSMGMSQDFHIAVEEGATMVRIGSKIFD